MELEDYLIEIEPSILAINRIAKVLANDLLSNFKYILKGKISYSELQEMYSLCKAIQMISFSMRINRKEVYKEVDADFNDEFTYSSMINEDFT